MKKILQSKVVIIVCQDTFFDEKNVCNFKELYLYRKFRSSIVNKNVISQK